MIANFKEEVPLSIDDRKAALEARQQIFDAKFSNLNPKKAEKRNIRPPELNDIPQALAVKRNIEIHPGGGVHSGFSKSKGSYIRLRETKNDLVSGKPEKTETRIGRHGPFDSDKTFEGKTITKTAPDSGEGPAARRRPPQSTSPAPDAETARSLMDVLFMKPQEVINALAEKPALEDYKDFGKRLAPPGSPKH